MHCPPLMLLRRTLGLSAVLISLPFLAMADPPPAAPPAGAGTPADEARGLVEPDPTTGSDVALAIPRAVLTIPRAALQVVSWPVVGAIRLEDEYHVLSWLEDLVYNDARTAAVIPYGAIDSHFGPSVGMVAFHDDAFGHEEKLHLSARFGGREKQAYELSFTAGHKTSVGAMVRFESAPSLSYHGLGADGPEATFAQDRFLALVRGGRRVGPVELTATAIYNHRTFGDGTMSESYDTMAIAGFEDGVETLELQGGVALSLAPLRVETFLGGVPAGARFVHWGAEATTAFTLWAPGRVLLVRAAAEGVEGDDVPFSDVPRLGGATRLRGYAADRFRGDHAYVGTVEYRYPVHQIVSGALFVDAGRVSGNDWHAGGGIGLVVHKRDRALFNLDVAYGEGWQLMVSTDPLRAFARKDTEL